MRRTLAVVSVLAVVISLAPLVAGGGDKAVICHVPPGNPEAAHTITIGAPAAEAHLGDHEGDTLGPCPGDGEQSPADKSPDAGKDEGTKQDETLGPSPSAVATGSATWLWVLLVALAAIAAATGYAIWRRRTGPR